MDQPGGFGFTCTLDHFKTEPDQRERALAIRDLDSREIVIQGNAIFFRVPVREIDLAGWRKRVVQRPADPEPAQQGYTAAREGSFLAALILQSIKRDPDAWKLKPGFVEHLSRPGVRDITVIHGGDGRLRLEDGSAFGTPHEANSIREAIALLAITRATKAINPPPTGDV